MTIDLHALAEALRYTNNALDQVGQPDYSLTDLVRDIRQNMKQAATALAKLQQQHEAERAAAVAEALERAAQECERYGSTYFARRVRSLQPRSDMMCVPREPTKGTIDEADVLRYEKAMLAAAEGKG